MFDELLEVVRLLRRRCPWDRKQTLATTRPTLLNETYELEDALRRRDRAAIAEELGDYLFVGLFLAQIAREELGIDPEELGGSAYEAAFTSFFLFAFGALFPMLPYFFWSGTLAIVLSLIISASAIPRPSRSVWLFVPIVLNGSTATERTPKVGVAGR